MQSRTDKEVLRVIDVLVELGVFSSKSEALRELIRASTKDYEKLARIAEYVKTLLEIEKETNETPIKLDGATKELLKERDEE